MARLPAVSTSVDDAIRLWLDHRLVVDGRSPATVRQYQIALDRFSRFLRQTYSEPVMVDQVEPETLLRFRAWLTSAPVTSTVGSRTGKRLRPETVASYMRATANLFNWCAENGLLNGPNPVRRGMIPAVPRDPKRAPDGNDIAKLLAVVEGPHAEYRGQVRYVPAFVARSRALLWVMLDTGMRVGELVNLDLTDYDPQRGALHVREGKGGHSRYAFLSPDAAHALNMWIMRPREQLLRRQPAQRAAMAKVMGLTPREVERYDPGDGYGRTNEGPLFVDKQGERLTAHGVRAWLRHLCQRAGVPVYRPHDLRRAYITQAAASGMALPQVMQQVGHVKAETTMRYIVSDQEIQRRAAVEHSPLTALRRRR